MPEFEELEEEPEEALEDDDPDAFADLVVEPMFVAFFLVPPPEEARVLVAGFLTAVGPEGTTTGAENNNCFCPPITARYLSFASQYGHFVFAGL